MAIILVDVDIPYNNGYGPTMVQSWTIRDEKYQASKIQKIRMIVVDYNSNGYSIIIGERTQP